MKQIELIVPENDCITHPLQEHHWPFEEETAAEMTDPTAGSGASQWNNLQIIAPDRSVPKSVTFEWQKLKSGWRSPAYRLEIAETQDFSTSTRVIKDLSKPTTDVWHLLIGHTYFWKVTAMRGDEVLGESAVRKFTTNSLPPRWIRVPGITNVRDIGGWPLPGGRRIAQGLVYRSSEMNGHLQISRKGMDVLELELGLRTDIDLRGELEGASPALDPARVRWIHLPISPYDSIADTAFRAQYRRIFQLFADSANYPILFHCVGGADRGGTVAFLLNALLGKSRDHLIRDYELTTLSVWGERSHVSEPFQALLDALEPFGEPSDLSKQVENYVLAIGVTRKEVDAIRRQLIED